MNRIGWLFLLLMIPCVLFSFGKNKVTYYDYDWSVLESRNFSVYLPKEHIYLSNYLLGTLESIYTQHCVSFGFSPSNKIKVMIYPNQIDFQQNNISEDWLDEGTGGFTEFTKGRVVVPFSADYPFFHHVISHELTHAFQIIRWGGGVISIGPIRDINIPLWLIEGGAEYNSIGLDKECEMMIADGVIQGKLPSLMELSSLYSLAPKDYFYIYKEGQMFYHFASEVYGPQTFVKLNNAIAKFRDFEAIITNTFGKSFQELDEEFFDYLRKRYLPEVSRLESVEMTGKRLLESDSFLNINATALDENRTAFISDRMIYPSILIYDKQKKQLTRAVKGGFDEDYLEFHYGKRNNLSYATNGTLCFVSRSGGDDVIQLYSLTTRETKKIALPFRIVNSPDVSRDGKRVVFSASDKGKMDIYIWEIENKNLIQVTDDDFVDTQPRWLGDRQIVFTSNRKHGFDSENFDILVYDLDKRETTMTYDSGFSDYYPTVSRDYKQIAFIRETVHPSLMILNLTNGTVYEEIVPNGGIMSPAFSPSGGLLFSSFSQNTFNLYEYQPRYTRVFTNMQQPTNNVAIAQSVPHFPMLRLDTKSYFPDFSVDNLIGTLVFNSSFGTSLIGVITMSDLLGDHRIQLAMDTTIQFQTNLLDYVNADLVYTYLKQRFDIGVHLYMFSNYFYQLNTFQSFYDMEKNYTQTWGGVAIFEYPFDTFNRFEASAGIQGFKYLTNRYLVGTNIVREYEVQNRNLIRAAFVHDSTLWDVTGPVDGTRYMLQLEKSFGLYPSSVDYFRIVLDYRAYLMLFPGYSFAFHLAAGSIFGTDKDKMPFYLGGFNSVRGYDFWQFSGDSTAVVNLEFRFPLITRLQLGFPLPISLPIIWGVVFWDFGIVGNLGASFQPVEYSGTTMLFKDIKSGFGIGLRLVLLPGIKLMADFSAPYYGNGIAHISTWRSFFQVGVDF